MQSAEIKTEFETIFGKLNELISSFDADKIDVKTSEAKTANSEN